jgi:methanethiol S-methyltransferase
MNHAQEIPAYGLWTLVIINSAIFILFAFKGDPHSNPIHLASNVVILGGFILLASAWRVLFAAQKTGTLATTGAYAHIRHPQYAAFMLIMIGFLLQWPTLPTLVMFPILVTVYVRLAHREEREARVMFGTQWDGYAARTPGFIPRLWGGDRTAGGERRAHA